MPLLLLLPKPCAQLPQHPLCTSAQRNSQQSSQLQLPSVYLLQLPLLLTALHLQATAASASLTYCIQNSQAAAHGCTAAAAADQLHCC
jgi:hypothetical protein